MQFHYVCITNYKSNEHRDSTYEKPMKKIQYLSGYLYYEIYKMLNAAKIISVFKFPSGRKVFTASVLQITFFTHMNEVSSI
jgi:UDP-N-acetylglucosamine:LPS N-acetylglucosamine transferase